MSEALQLFDTPPSLTARQQAALNAITKAHQDGGAHYDEIGAAAHAASGKHGIADRCQWCGQDGRDLAQTLQAKRLIAKRVDRRPSGERIVSWVLSRGPAPAPRTKPGRVPYNEFPRGF